MTSERTKEARKRLKFVHVLDYFKTDYFNECCHFDDSDEPIPSHATQQAVYAVLAEDDAYLGACCIRHHEQWTAS